MMRILSGQSEFAFVQHRSFTDQYPDCVDSFDTQLLGILKESESGYKQSASFVRGKRYSARAINTMLASTGSTRSRSDSPRDMTQGISTLHR